MSYTQSNPFSLSLSWSAAAPYGASAFPEKWSSVSTITDPTYASVFYYAATPPAGLGVVGQMTVIGDGSNQRTAFFVTHDTNQDDELTGQKFDQPANTFNAGVDEGLGVATTSFPFACLPRRDRNLGFPCSTHSRLMLFACEEGP